MKKILLVVSSLALVGCSYLKWPLIGAGLVGVIKTVGSSGDLPEPPGWEKPTPTPTATPSPAPTVTPTRTPSPEPTPIIPVPGHPCEFKNELECDCYFYQKLDWLYRACPTETPTPSPVCWAPPEPPADPVSFAFPIRCPKGFDPLEFDIAQTAPSGFIFCAARSVCWPDCSNRQTIAWAVGYGAARQGLSLKLINGKWLQPDEPEGQPVHGCTDAYGRWFPDCGDKVYVNAQYPDGAYEHGGFVPPYKCQATPSPSPTSTSTPKPASISCKPVEDLQNHWIAGAGHCHAWKVIGGNKIRCLLDSTVRPICDTEHLDNWNSFCGQRTHDPDYAHLAGAQIWKISGAEDLGPNCSGDEDPNCNSAQRWIQGDPGAEIHVTICFRPGVKTADGCSIPVRGDGCTEETPFNLPQLGDQ